MKRYNYFLPAAIAAGSLLMFSWPEFSAAIIQGPCSDCHTMHNSQGNLPMTFDGSSTPNDNLTRGSCLGCHAMAAINTPTYDLSTDRIPLVLHGGTVDLAGGNFLHSNTDQNMGHNIDELTGPDGVLITPPGMYDASAHNSIWTDRRLSCTTIPNETAGCHGYRRSTAYPDGISGSHHNNVDGQLAAPTVPADSYRFLYLVQGYEDPDWEEDPAVGHNEYYGLTAPIRLGCGAGNTSCHGGTIGVRAPDGTMSQFCASCHANFHSLDNGDDVGIGTDAVSPFLRHPTDLVLPDIGEYSTYTTYSSEAPVARTTAGIGVPAAPDNTVYPGEDAVMCLSCHRAHASAYPDMLRWDYNDMVVGSGNAGGCFTCHTTKN